MSRVHRISDLDLPELAPYRSMRFQDEHRAAGVFVAEGDKVVHRLCESSIEVVSAVLPENRLAEFEAELISKRADMPIFVAPRKALEQLTGFASTRE